jgi:hypothetical protein
MTHSLHRVGGEESLRQDFVLLCTPARGINDCGSRDKLLKAFDIILAAGPVNLGFYGLGSLADGISLAAMREHIRDGSRLRFCFDDANQLETALRSLKDADLGISISVTGVLEEVYRICSELDIQPHTANISCGVWGRRERLPSEEILELTTMCGHGLIAPQLVGSVLRELRAGELTLQEAVEQLQKPCVCGIFNPTRAARLLASRVGVRAEDPRAKSP